MKTYMANQLIGTLWMLGAVICKTEGVDGLIFPLFLIAGWYYLAAMVSYWIGKD